MVAYLGRRCQDRARLSGSAADRRDRGRLARRSGERRFDESTTQSRSRRLDEACAVRPTDDGLAPTCSHSGREPPRCGLRSDGRQDKPVGRIPGRVRGLGDRLGVSAGRQGAGGYRWAGPRIRSTSTC